MVKTLRPENIAICTVYGRHNLAPKVRRQRRTFGFKYMGITVYVTYPNLKEAKKITNHLLKKKLVACANFWPIKSMYWWKGKIENDNEVVAILKTRKENWNKVKTEIKKMHP